MGTKHVIRYGRHPKEKEMKYIILASVLLTGCAHSMAPDPKKCCERVSLHNQEMEKFTRYCKVALFLANSENTKEVGSGVRKGARDAVNVCKFVFDVDTDDELVIAGDQQDYYKVRSYIIKDPNHEGQGGWYHPQCDPAEMHCEEF